jgi:lysophospholipase L1-like esterase
VSRYHLGTMTFSFDVRYSSCRPLLRASVLWLALLPCFSALAQGPQAVVEPRLPPATTAPIAAAVSAAYARWQGPLTDFVRADKEHLPGNDGVLFVGSSTIRMWTNLAQDFRQVPVVINRGFGGSTLADCSLFARELVVRYKPKQVLVYAGDNDLAEGQSPLQVLESFVRFEKTVRAELPNVRIDFISIKPSPSREGLIDKIRTTNRLIAGYVHTLHNSAYIDIYTPMLDEEGHPRVDLFRPDQLHLNDSGYRLWQSIIVSHLMVAAATPNPSVTRATP